MSEQTDSTPVAEQPQEGAEPRVFDAEYVAKIRQEAAKYRTEAKANADAAKRLAEIEEQNKSADEKNADRIAKAEQRAVDAEARALRREVALEHRLSSEDAALLDNLTDEDAMRKFAKRLANAADDRVQHGNVVPREGNNPNPDGSAGDAQFARSLFTPAG